MDQDLLRVEAYKLILGILGKGESPIALLGNSSFLSGVKTVQK